MILKARSITVCQALIATEFKYGKALALEALEATKNPVEYRASLDTETFPMLDFESACEFIHDASRWKRVDWLSKWDDFKDFIGKSLFPEYYHIFHDRGYKMAGHSARVLARDTIHYIESIKLEWDSCSSVEPTEDEKQLVLDLLYSVLKKSLLFSRPLTYELKERLVKLCEQYKRFPQMLEIKNLKFRGAAASEGNADPVASGGNADIYLAVLHGKEVAVKVPRFKKSNTVEKHGGWTPLHKEALNWIFINECPGINSFLGLTFQHERGIGLVFKYQKNGNVMKQVPSLDGEVLSDFVCINSFYIADAINSLHQQNYIHGDIKAENILMDEKHKPVLTDFGSMLRLIRDEYTECPNSSYTYGDYLETSTSSGSKDLGTCRFMSKERSFNGSSLRGEADDVWAIGMTLIQLLTKEIPFKKRYKEDSVFLLALADKIELERSDLPESIPDELFDAIKRCLCSEPEDRLSSFELFTILGKIAGGCALRGHLDDGCS